MIIYELIINAMRHAFEGGGEIRVAVRRDGTFVKCSVQDNGSNTGNIQPGRGLKIAYALSNALGGRFKQAFGPSGSASLLVFPCAGDSNNRRVKRQKRNLARDDELFITGQIPRQNDVIVRHKQPNSRRS